MRFVVLGNAANRRVHFFQDALAAHDQAPATVLTWASFLTDHSLLGLLDDQTILRIDSPEGEFDADTAFLALGAPYMAAETGEYLPLEQSANHQHDGSGLRFARQRSLGFAHALQQVQNDLETSGARCTHLPHDIALMSHKAQCHRYLTQQGLPLPPTIGSEDTDKSDEALTPQTRVDAVLGAIEESELHGAFIKLWHGSSAAGIAALRHTDQGPILLTSMAFARAGPFNSLRLREYTSTPHIKRVLHWLYQEGAHTEAWLPKLRVAGREFDLRVVTVAGQASQVAVRVSRHESPMTNLHFGNERGDPDEIMALVGAERWDQGMAICERAAGLFPHSLCIGFDLMFTRDAAPVLIEANPFGDLLPGIYFQGRTTYEAQAAAALARYGE